MARPFGVPSTAIRVVLALITPHVFVGAEEEAENPVRLFVAHVISLLQGIAIIATLGR